MNEEERMLHEARRRLVSSSKRYCRLYKIYIRMKLDMKFDHKSHANSINATKARYRHSHNIEGQKCIAHGKNNY